MGKLEFEDGAIEAEDEVNIEGVIDVAVVVTTIVIVIAGAEIVEMTVVGEAATKGRGCDCVGGPVVG